MIHPSNQSQSLESTVEFLVLEAFRGGVAMLRVAGSPDSGYSGGANHAVLGRHGSLET